MKTRAVLAALLAVSTAGCFAPAKARRYFGLEPLPADVAGPSFDKVLLIDRVAVDDVYDDFRIIYRLSPTEINYYSYEFWAAKPDKMIRDAISHYLAVRRAFRRVEVEAGREDPDWVFRCRVHRLEEVDALEQWSARLAMDFEMRDFKTGGIVGRRSFDRSLPLPQKLIADLPLVLSRILAEELEAFLADLAGK
jgi:ABC-type uncharacterized transport system auxiliary subunit